MSLFAVQNNLAFRIRDPALKCLKISVSSLT